MFGTSCSGDIISTLNLSGYYKMNSDVTDSSGNAINGTTVGSPTYSTGKYGNAISLNGTSQYVTTADNVKFEGSGGSISVFAWVNITDFASDANPHIAAKWGTTTGWRLVPRAGDILVTLAGTNTGRGTGVATGSFQHIGFTFDNNNLKIYQNGAQVGTTAVIGAKTLANTETMYIGRRNNGADGYLKGLMDEVSVWQRVLSDSEISTMYNSSCPLRS